MALFDRYTHPDGTIEVYPFNHHEGGEAPHTNRQLRWLAPHLHPR